jgi:hypothetical protein
METQRVKRPKDPKYKKYTKGVDKTWQDMARHGQTDGKQKDTLSDSMETW